MTVVVFFFRISSLPLHIIFFFLFQLSTSQYFIIMTNVYVSTFFPPFSFIIVDSTDNVQQICVFLWRWTIAKTLIHFPACLKVVLQLKCTLSLSFCLRGLNLKGARTLVWSNPLHPVGLLCMIDFCYPTERILSFSALACISLSGRILVPHPLKKIFPSHSFSHFLCLLLLSAKSPPGPSMHPFYIMAVMSVFSNYNPPTLASHFHPLILSPHSVSRPLPVCLNADEVHFGDFCWLEFLWINTGKGKEESGLRP